MQTLAADSRPGGFAVVECKRWRWGLPLVHAESWLGDFPISRTPLLNPSDPAGNCAALIEEIFDRTDAAALLLPYVTGHHVASSVLVNIRGEKFVHLVDNADGMLVSEEAREIAPSKHRNQHYEPSFEDRTQVFTLNAGDGVHIPYTQPHWVRTGADYCNSIAMTWKTPEVLRMNKIRLMNGTLRRFGLPQAGPGVYPVANAAKVMAHDSMRALLDPLRKSESVRNGLRGLIYGRKANYFLKGAPGSKA